MKISVLGTEYTLLRKNYDEDPLFEKQGIDGYCDSIDKVIVVCNMKTYPEWGAETDEYCKKQEKHILRHELIHAFLNESGLQDSSGRISNLGWSKNEEMIDFFAIQFPKIAKLFQELDIL